MIPFAGGTCAPFIFFHPRQSYYFNNNGNMTQAIAYNYRAPSESMPLHQFHESLEATSLLYDGDSNPLKVTD